MDNMEWVPSWAVFFEVWDGENFKIILRGKIMSLDFSDVYELGMEFSNNGESMEKLFVDILIFLCVCIGLSVALIPFYKHINDDINKRYKEEE